MEYRTRNDFRNHPIQSAGTRSIKDVYRSKLSFLNIFIILLIIYIDSWRLLYMRYISLIIFLIFILYLLLLIRNVYLSYFDYRQEKKSIEMFFNEPIIYGKPSIRKLIIPTILYGIIISLYMISWVIFYIPVISDIPVIIYIGYIANLGQKAVVEYFDWVSDNTQP